MIQKILLFLFATQCMLVPCGAQQQMFTVEPYLQNPSQSGMTIMWRVPVPSHGWVEYGVDTLSLQKAQAVCNGIVVANTTENKVRLNNLSAGQNYYYRIGSREVKLFGAYKKEFGEIVYSPFYSFKTFDNKGSDFTVVIFNDIHSKLPVFEKLVDQLVNIKYDFAIFNGDCFQDPSSEENELKVLSTYNAKLNGSEKPLFFLRGNHETRGVYALAWPSLFDWDGNRPYFAFTYGDTRFVLLDNGEDKVDSAPEYNGLASYTDFRNEETEWLKKEIESKEYKQAKRKILVHHTPLYGWENKYSPGFIACKDLWDPIFKKTNFDVAITGHLHQYNFYQPGEKGNPYPQVIGGGNNDENATVIVLEKRGKNVTMRVLKIDGDEIVHKL